MLDNLFAKLRSKSSLVYLLVWSPPPPYIFFLYPCRNRCPYHRSLFCCSTKIISQSFSQLLTWNSVFYLNIIHPSDHSHLCSLKCHLITARCYASAVLRVVILSVCLSHACFVTNPKKLLAIFYTTWKDNPSSFLPHSSGWWATSPSTFNGRSKWPTSLQKSLTSTDFRL